MAKPVKNGKKKPGKLHVEIPKANWARLEAFLKAYNEAPERVSSPLKYTDLINQALDAFLPGKPEPAEPAEASASENPPPATAEQVREEAPLEV